MSRSNLGDSQDFHSGKCHLQHVLKACLFEVQPQGPGIEAKGEAGLGKKLIREGTPEPVTAVRSGGLEPAGAPQRSVANA